MVEKQQHFGCSQCSGAEPIYTSLFATKSHSTYYKNRNRKKFFKVTYINRQSTISREQTKSQHLYNRIYSKYCMQCCQSRKQNHDCIILSIILRSFAEYAVHKHSNSLVAPRTNNEHTVLSESMTFCKNLTFRICICCFIGRIPNTARHSFMTSFEREQKIFIKTHVSKQTKLMKGHVTTTDILQ